MIHTHDAIRKHLQKKIRPNPRITLSDNPLLGDRPPLEELKATQWIPQFETYMRNRLVMGALRYETFMEKRRHNTYEIIKSINRRLKLYEETGNQEHLVDCANLLMIEYECPTHPSPHFTALEDTNTVTKTGPPK